MRFSLSRCQCVKDDGTIIDDDVERAVNHMARVNTQNGTGWTMLHVAAWHGSVDVTRGLIDMGANVLSENENRELPIHLAAFNNHANIIDMLYNAAGSEADQKKMVQWRQVLGQTPIFYAINGVALNAASKLLDFGASITAVDAERKEPIHYAVQLDLVESVDFLIRHGANMESRCCFEPNIRSAYHLAAEFNSVDVFQGRLLERLEDFIVTTPLYGQELMCICAAYDSVEFAKLLVRSQPQLSYMANCTFDRRVGQPLHVAVFKQHLHFVEFLLNRADTDVNALDSLGSTALIEAVKKSDVGITSILLENNAKVDCIEDATGQTPFLIAAKTSSSPVAKLLVAKLADPFAKDKKGNNAFHLTNEVTFGEYLVTIRGFENVIDEANDHEFGSLTPLHVAILEQKSVEFTRLLLEHSSDPLKNNEWSHSSAFHMAVEIDDSPIFDVLLQYKSGDTLMQNFDRFGRNPFHLAIARNNLDIGHSVLKVVGSKITNVAINDGSSETALHIAARYGFTEAADLLLLNGADVSIRSSKDQRTPVLEALFWRHFEVVKILLERYPRRDLSEKDVEGRHMLHYAVLHNEDNLVRFLLTHVPNAVQLNSPDNQGDTALHYAVRLNNYGIISRLLNSPLIDCKKLNNEGQSPLHLAASLNLLHMLGDIYLWGNCDISQPDIYGRSALELEQVKGRDRYIEHVVDNYGSSATCEGAAKRLMLAIKLDLKPMAAMIKMEKGQRCDKKMLYTYENPSSLSVLFAALMKRDIETIEDALDNNILSEATATSRYNAAAMMKALLFGQHYRAIITFLDQMHEQIRNDGTCALGLF